MRLLVLGGTVFLGRHVVRLALARGHDVTLFHRGKSNPGVFPEAEHVLGDRDGGLAALDGREWDAVVDTSGYVPRVVGASAAALSGRAGHYTFVSSGSVYPHPVPRGADESAAVGELDDPAIEEVTGETYGPLKALCERAATDAFSGPVLNVRAGLIVGPHDPTDRFTYWPLRMARGGPVLAPDRPEQPVQWIDVRDLAGWILDMAARGEGGTFNAAGPAEPATFRELLATCAEVAGGGSPVWTDAAFLAEHEVRPWVDLPLALPEEAEDMSTMSAAKAIAQGLAFRPLADTARDTLEWARARPADAPLRAGLVPEREADLLAAWRSR
jgi:2'-hydroxyisoflavone reductase